MGENDEIPDINLKETINRVLEEDFEIDPDDLIPDAALFTDLELDSLDIVDLIVALEQAFGIKIRNNAAEAFRDVRTLGDLYETIEKMYKKLKDQS